MGIINEENLAHYLELGYNVLFRGRHGVGKTAIVKKVFESAGYSYMYVSASTLDPWVDFVGVPRVVERPGMPPVIDLVRPKSIEDDSINAIFIDELNRARDKVINAVMELIQFRSINGHKLKNLKVVWAAINPEDDEDTYSVGHLDPAHVDRFHVQIDVPYKVDEDYFRKRHPSVAQAFIDWWKALPVDIRHTVSPRRLDYAADAYANKCRLEDFLPVESNVKALRDVLKNLPFLERVSRVASESDAVEFLRDVNNTTKMLDLLKSEESTVKDFFKKYARHIPKELAAPFVECLQAKKSGLTGVGCIEEMIEKLPGDRGDASIAAIINGLDLPTMTSDLRDMSVKKRHLVKKLALRVSDILIGCTPQTINRLFWGPQGRAGNAPQNMHTISAVLGSMDDAFTVMQRAKINAKLYDNKIVDTAEFLRVAQ